MKNPYLKLPIQTEQDITQPLMSKQTMNIKEDVKNTPSEKEVIILGNYLQHKFCAALRLMFTPSILKWLSDNFIYNL